MFDPLQYIWPAVEAISPVFSRAAVMRWPTGVHAQLLAAKLIVADGSAGRIRCSACGQTHTCRVSAREQPGGGVCYFIPCPTHLRAEVSQNDLQQWSVNLQELVHVLAAALSLRGQPADLGSRRVWRCGRTQYAGVSRDVLFGRGLCRRDAAQFRGAIAGARRPIVFVGSELPPSEYWNGRVPALVRLCDVAALTTAGLGIDVDHIMGTIADSDRAPAQGDSIAVPKAELKRIVRQQVKAEAKATLDDDVLVAAFRQTHSYRKAAELLGQNPEASEKVSKDRVMRAVDRAGGIAAVLQNTDTASVSRTVPSQCRDRATKFMKYR